MQPINQPRFTAIVERQLHGCGQSLAQLHRCQAAATEIEPYTLDGGWCVACALAEQHALAGTGRRAQQAQSRLAGEQALQQGWAGNHTRRQSR